MQFPLHEPYFDLTPIKVMHTKIICIYICIYLYILIYTKTKLIAHTPFSAWRVVSALLRLDSPWRGDSRLLVIPYSCSRVTDYNPYYILFWGLAPFYNIASLCKGMCGTSIAHNIMAMMTCLSPSYLVQYSGEPLYVYK